MGREQKENKIVEGRDETVHPHPLPKRSISSIFFEVMRLIMFNGQTNYHITICEDNELTP